MGAMIMGPLAAYVMKKLDALWDGKIRPGFEMLVDNFSAGILGGDPGDRRLLRLGPIVLDGHPTGSATAVDFLVDNDLLPLTSLFIEPAKVLFLNNAINHGVLTPLGIQRGDRERQVDPVPAGGQPRPGPGPPAGLHALRHAARPRRPAPGAAIIQFFGGIHEIYFPYVLMKPKLILATILGGMTGVFINVLFDSGLRAPAAPGSIIAVYAQTASGQLRRRHPVGDRAARRSPSWSPRSCSRRTRRTTRRATWLAATGAMESMKGKKSGRLRARGSGVRRPQRPDQAHRVRLRRGHGLARRWAPRCCGRRSRTPGFADVTVVNKAIANLTDTYDVVVTHQDLTGRAGQRTPSAVHVSVDNFMGSPRYDEIVEHGAGGQRRGRRGRARRRSQRQGPVGSASCCPMAPSCSNGTALNRDEAITEAGLLLVASGAVEPAYVEAMHEREKSVSTYMGNSLAHPARHQRGQVPGQARPASPSSATPTDRLEGQAGEVRDRGRQRGR